MFAKMGYYLGDATKNLENNHIQLLRITKYLEREISYLSRIVSWLF